MLTSIIFALIIVASFVLLFVLINKYSNNFLVNKIKEITLKTRQLTIKIHDKWYFWPILFFLIYVLNLIIFLIFTNSLGAPDVLLYGEGVNYSEAAKVARSFVSKLNYLPITLFGLALTLVTLIYFIVKVKQKKLTYLHSIILILVLGSVLRIVYGNVTDNIFTRQHDVWSSSGYGHYQITMHIFNDFTLPPLKNGLLSNSYQMYHPKFVHYTHAIFMHTNSLFIKGNPSWSLYQSIRIFSITISIFTMIISYLIIKEIFIDKKSQIIALLFFTFSPIMIRFAPSSNNDALLFFFITSTIYFLIKFIKKQNYFNIIFIAISIGLAMASKLSGALIAIPTAIVFLILFIKFIKNKQYKNILMFVIFALICFPLALYWPIFNFINYDQPFNYVFSNLNNKLAIPLDATFINRFLIFDLNQYFNSLYMQLWAGNSIPQITNLYAAMIKSSIFGEFSYVGLSSGFGVILYATNIVLVSAIILFGLYVLLNLIKQKRIIAATLIIAPIVLYVCFVLIQSKNIPLILVAGVIALISIYFFIKYFKEVKNILKFKKFEALICLIFIVFMISYFSFQTQYPYTCTLDYRYVAIFSLLAGCLISMFLKGSRNKTINVIIYLILGIYLSSAYLMYIFVGL